MALLDELLANAGMNSNLPSPMGMPPAPSGPPLGLDQILRQQAPPMNVQAPPPEAPPKQRPRDVMKSFMGDFLFTLGEAFKASSQYRGRQGTQAGMGAALQAPMLLESIKQKQAADQAQAQQEADYKRAQMQRMSAQSANEQLQNAISLARETREANKPPAERNIDPLSPEGVAAAIEKEKGIAAVKPPNAANLQSKEIVGPDGKPSYANFNPDTGKFYDLAGKEIQNARPYERPQDPAIAALREVQTSLAKMQVEGMGLTPSQRATEINTLRNSWTQAIKPVTERRQSIAKIDAGLDALKRKNYNAATQIIVTAFNKLQDETSVVREGEYLRSEQGQALMNRIRGSIDRLTRGGSALTDKDLMELAGEAKNVAMELEKAQSESLGNLRKSIESQLDDYKIPHDRVFGNSKVGSTVKMRAPDGTVKNIPEGEVDWYRSKGAVVVPGK